MAGLSKVLIANRGEIAIRIAKAAAALGIESVAVYPAVDQLALHTRVTTSATEIAGVAVDAYLNAAELIAAAQRTGCDSVHPGYGFVAENADFAAACQAAGLVFVGPPADVLRLFGNKVAARELAQSLGIPVVAGGTVVRAAEHLRQQAARVGYPVMLKAAAGGGGRGMRLIQHERDANDAFERCQSEALAAFGDGTLFLEKYVARPRHIEVQILADSTGDTVHLFERDCSVQLRNQKVVEIAPAPNLDAGVRAQLMGAAIRLAKAANYVNAGTVEFLVNPETNEYFFIECNPRIQVEHTVTELVTGIDLVESQFQIAGGASLAALGLNHREAIAAPQGYAVQCRVVAGAGVISAYKEPSGPGVRVDGCGYAGYAPPPQFDPLLAKVIGRSNSSRSFVSAVDRTLAALNEFHIAGLPNNLIQLRQILANETFRSGDARTTLLSEKPALLEENTLAAGRTLTLLERQAKSVARDNSAAARCRRT
ncbi:MAG: ATP-grasp domain-containing protein [Gammaproteobacteria bacterium]|nr:ATP-grasp domain-containing protein [Gammaproteobacteria bacterium]